MQESFAHLFRRSVVRCWEWRGRWLYSGAHTHTAVGAPTLEGWLRVEPANGLYSPGLSTIGRQFVLGEKAVKEYRLQNGF